MAFLDIQFPKDIALGATGGPVWNTVVLDSPSGYQQMVQNWDEPKLVYEFDSEIWDESRVNQLISFFNVVGGMANSFRFRDWSDYYVGMIAGSSGPTYTTPQQIGVGNSSTTAFQLFKRYATGAYSRDRKITKPINGTVKIYKDGVEQTSGVSVNHSTGVVTFTSAPATGVVVSACFQFDCHCRFDSDRMSINMSAVFNGAWQGVMVVGVRD